MVDPFRELPQTLSDFPELGFEWWAYWLLFVS
jgi:hypothetical protein